MTDRALDRILSHVEKLRTHGEDSWSGCCPAHADDSPSLTIADRDGVILLHCFGGCSVDAIAAACGVELSELFPPARGSHEPVNPLRRPIPAGALLRVAAHEALVVAIAASKIANGEEFTPSDHARIVTSVERLQDVAKLGGVRDE